MVQYVPQIAKAIAAALTPVVVAAVVATLDWIGADVRVDPSWVETVIASAVTALAVYLVPNKPTTPKD